MKDVTDGTGGELQDEPADTADHAAAQRRRRLSAAMDGEATPQQWLEMARASGDPAEHQAQCDDWAVYHLIGDALRSEDLAVPAASAPLLARVRKGLEAEPVVLAPAALVPPRRARPQWRVWAASAAAVAGFSVVGATFLVTRVDGPPEVSLARMADGGASLSWPSLWGGESSSTAGVPRSSMGLAPQASDDLRRAGAESPAGLFREVMRLPRGPAGQPAQSLQILYSDGSAHISVLIEPDRPGFEPEPAPPGGRLQSLRLQRRGEWITLTGDVPPAVLSQVAAQLLSSP